MDWVRLYHDMPSDPKWRVIAKKAGQRIGDVIAVYVFLLTNASSNAVKRGVTQGFVTEDVAAALDLDDASVDAILGAMEGKVIKKGELLGWEKRNPKREDSSYDRVKKHRETQRNAVKRPETDTEIDQKEKEVSSAEPKTALALVDDPCLISLPTNSPGRTYNVLQSQFDQFQALYPGVDVAQDLRAMAGWLIANPKNAKTVSGMPRFMNSWLSKSQNRSRPNERGPSKNDNWLAGGAALSSELAADRQ